MTMMRKFFDGFTNWAAGIGVAGEDKSVANSYRARIVSPMHFEELYRSSAFGRRVVDIPAGDMTREWRTWLQEPEKMKAAEKKDDLRNLFKSAIITGQKQGAAGVYMAIKGDLNTEEPLDIDKIGKGDLEWLTMFSRNELSVVEHDNDPLSPRYRKGKLFSIQRGDKSSELRIHFSRFIWFGGVATDSETAEVQDGWDDPVYLGIEPLIHGADSAFANINALVHEARTETMKIPELAKYFEDAESEARLTKRVTVANYLKSSLHTRVIDGEEDVKTDNITFTGLADIFVLSLEMLGGARDIPIVRFVGKSPTGMNATGQSELRNYYDGIRALQENDLARALSDFDQVYFRHIIGKPPTDDSDLYTWVPLWQMTEVEKAEVSKKKAETTKIYADMSIFEPEFFAMCVLDQLKDDNIYPTIAEHLADLASEEEAIEITAPVEPKGDETDTVKEKV